MMFDCHLFYQLRELQFAVFSQKAPAITVLLAQPDRTAITPVPQTI